LVRRFFLDFFFKVVDFAGKEEEVFCIFTIFLVVFPAPLFPKDRVGVFFLVAGMLKAFLAVTVFFFTFLASFLIDGFSTDAFLLLIALLDGFKTTVRRLFKEPDLVLRRP